MRGSVPVRPEQAPDALESLRDRMGVYVQFTRAFGHTLAGLVVGVERLDEGGGALCVVLEQGTERAGDEIRGHGMVAQEESDEPQLGRGRGLPGSSQRDQSV